ncbi:MAG TPA: glutamate--tRNA ligase family protein [Opitutaceae bacterium]|jgi:glutamyl-tRNA synthetase
MSPPGPYRGRLAPSPTGYLHSGHAQTFWTASERARAAGGALVLRNDDLDSTRYRMDFEKAMYEDLHWLGLRWEEGPDVGGPFAPYSQSARVGRYRQALGRLHAAGLVFACSRTRRDVAGAAGAPHEGGEDDEPLYPARFRPEAGAPPPPLWETPDVNWRLRVPDGQAVEFVDGRLGPRRAVAGVDFGDFPVWRKDDCPSYQLACAVDDAEMGITEVVRGEDLVRSTFRQILIQRALGLATPAYYHCPLMTDARGVRLAKRSDAQSLRALRAAGRTPEEVRASWNPPGAEGS